MARKRTCSGCGYRNPRRAWTCTACGRSTGAVMRVALAVAAKLAIAGVTVFYVQGVIRSALPH